MDESVVSRADSIFGNATFTTDESINAIAEPSTHAANIHVCRHFTHGEAFAVERMINSSQGRA
jgi:hypothetical protein